MLLGTGVMTVDRQVVAATSCVADRHGPILAGFDSAPYIRFELASVRASVQVLLIMVALWNRADHYIFILSFVLLSSSIFFSSPNLIRRRLDVFHTSTHGVALVRI